jgi:hypothetical protein
MQKISTLFMRDPQDRRRLTREVHRRCQWVIDGEGVAKRKYDGKCVILDEFGNWWARLEVRPGEEPPPGFCTIAEDRGIRVGAEPLATSPWAKYFDEAIELYRPPGSERPLPGTYELYGPEINGNPEDVSVHSLVYHSDAPLLDNSVRSYDSLREYLSDLPYEGIVWFHDDGRKAKIKRRDVMDAP